MRSMISSIFAVPFPHHTVTHWPISSCIHPDTPIHFPGLDHIFDHLFFLSFKPPPPEQVSGAISPLCLILWGSSCCSQTNVFPRTEGSTTTPGMDRVLRPINFSFTSGRERGEMWVMTHRKTWNLLALKRVWLIVIISVTISFCFKEGTPKRKEGGEIGEIHSVSEYKRKHAQMEILIPKDQVLLVDVETSLGTDILNQKVSHTKQTFVSVRDVYTYSFQLNQMNFEFVAVVMQ